MFCEKCGKELPDDALFCSACGAAVKKESEGLKETQSVPRKKNNTIIVCLIIVIVLLVAVCLIMMITGNGLYNNSQPSSIMAFKERTSSSTAPQPSTVSSVAGVETPSSVVEGYLKNFDKAVNSNSVAPIESYMKAGSPIYKSQSEYVQTSIKLNLDTYEIVNEETEFEMKSVVTSRASYYVIKEGQPREYITEECRYVVEKTNGHWQMVDFADEVKILNRTQR